MTSWCFPPSGSDAAGLPVEDGLRASSPAVPGKRFHHPGDQRHRQRIPPSNLVRSRLVLRHPMRVLLTPQTLRDFQYVDRDGRDQGANVREKARQLVCLLRDEERLRQERSQALKTKERMAGGGSGGGGGGSGGGERGGMYGGIPPSYHPGRRTSQPSMAVLYGEEFSRSRGSPSSFNCEFPRKTYDY